MIQWHQNSFFFQKIPKNPPGVRPQTPVCMRLIYTGLLNTSPNSDIFNFWFIPSSYTKVLVKYQQHRPRLLIFHCTISLPPQKVPLLKISDDVNACDLWSSPLPQWYAYAYGTEMTLFSRKQSLFSLNHSNGCYCVSKMPL